MMFRAFLALFLAFMVTLGRAEDGQYFECQSKPEPSNNHYQLKASLLGLADKITELEEGIKYMEITAFHIHDCNQKLTQATVPETGLDQLRKAPCAPDHQLRKAPCAPDHQLFEGSCYFFSSGKEDWSTAQQQCLEIGGNLAKITNDDEFLFIQNQITEDTWIGLSDQDKEGEFKWIADGSIHIPGTSLSPSRVQKRDYYAGSGDYGSNSPYGANSLYMEDDTVLEVDAYDTWSPSAGSGDYDSDEDYGYGEDYYLDADDDDEAVAEVDADADDGVIWWNSGEPNNDWRGEDCVEFRNVTGSYRLNDVPCELKQKYVCETERDYIHGQ